MTAVSRPAFKRRLKDGREISFSSINNVRLWMVFLGDLTGVKSKTVNNMEYCDASAPNEGLS
ncbi:hypothetical protein E4U51_005661 [Claviceps purpurea]|nr:hypothetical protein E4U51_005661 [Claviceps purpurea]